MNVIALVSFELNSPDLLDGWKDLSAEINENLRDVDGFISRYSALGEDGKVYCIVQWENAEKQAAFRKIMESDAFKEKTQNFMKFVNMATMKSESLKVL